MFTRCEYIDTAGDLLTMSPVCEFKVTSSWAAVQAKNIDPVVALFEKEVMAFADLRTHRLMNGTKGYLPPHLHQEISTNLKYHLFAPPFVHAPIPLLEIPAARTVKSLATIVFTARSPPTR